MSQTAKLDVDAAQDQLVHLSHRIAMLEADKGYQTGRLNEARSRQGVFVGGALAGAQTAAIQPAPITINTIYRAHDRIESQLQNLLDKVQRLNDHVNGSAPRGSDASAQGTAPANGMVERLHRDVGTIETLVAKIQDQLEYAMNPMGIHDPDSKPANYPAG